MKVSKKIALPDAGVRLDVFLKNETSESRSFIQQIIKNGNCSINGGIVRNPSKKLVAEELLEWEIPNRDSRLVGECNTVQTLWRDDDLLVCQKPAALAVHPASSQKNGTLIQQLISDYPKLLEMGGERPGIVHRLDKDTSGLLLVALNEPTRQKLAEMFAERLVHKEYLCLVAGKPEKSGEIDKPIGRHPTLKTRMAIVPESCGGKPARTEWHLLRYFPDGDFSLLAVRIHTGRTHQIRVHFADLGFPLLGDRLYAPPVVSSMAPRQMLHAWKLSFNHPVHQKSMRFILPPPEDFMETMISRGLQIPLLVVTGRPGSGKSAVTNLLAEQGLPAIFADAVIQELYAKPSALTDWTAMNLGRHIVEGGKIIKAKLFEIFQNSPQDRKRFERYAHRLVFDEIENFWLTHKDKSKWVVAEIPLYFESVGERNFKPAPFVLGVHCTDETRRQRLRDNRDWDFEKIAAIDAWQWPEEKKMAACDLVLDNEGSLDNLHEEVEAALQKLDALFLERQERLEKEINDLINWNIPPVVE